MDAAVINRTGALADLREIENRLAALFEEAGYLRRDPSHLQPADIFLDFSGEDIRRRLFMTEGADGQSMCLRPEFTIPLSIEFLRNGGDQPADLYAAGPVFRQRPGESGEFVQIGIERFGHAPADVIDAECFALAIQTMQACGVPQPKSRIGDVGMLTVLLDRLGVSPAARRRLMRTLGAGGSIDALIGDGADGSAKPFSGVLKVLERAEKADAKAFVKDVLSIAGISKVGGRDSDAIADRFLRRAAGETAMLTAATAERLTRFLEIAGEPDRAVEALRAYAEEEELDLEAPIGLIESRIGFMSPRASTWGMCASRRPSCAISIITPVSFSTCRAKIPESR